MSTRSKPTDQSPTQSGSSRTDAAGTTLVIGLGEVGAPLLRVLLRGHPSAVGIDLDPQPLARRVEVVHLCIPFKLQAVNLQTVNVQTVSGEVVSGKPAEVTADFVTTCVDYCRRYTPRLAIVHSTVLPGTTRQIETRSGIPVVYSPVRGKHDRMESELQTYQKFVAGTDPEAVALAQAHLQSCGIRTATMPTPETLELAKLLETTYFALLVAWAQEMNRWGDAVGAEYSQMTRFFEEISYLPRHLFLPGHIGGHCLMSNIALLQRYLDESADKSLDTSALGRAVAGKALDSGLLLAIKRSNDLRRAELGVGEELPRHRARLVPVEVSPTKNTKR